MRKSRPKKDRMNFRKTSLYKSLRPYLRVKDRKFYSVKLLPQPLKCPCDQKNHFPFFLGF